MTNETEMREAFTYSPQDGKNGHCFAAQVWDAEGKNVAIVEGVNAEEANKRAKLITDALNNQARARLGKGEVEYTQSKLNADIVGLDCRAAFEKHYLGYYLRRGENGEYTSEETRKLWNCWWVSWDYSNPRCCPIPPSAKPVEVGEEEAVRIMADAIMEYEQNILTDDHPTQRFDKETDTGFMSYARVAYYAFLSRYNVTVKEAKDE